MAQPIRFTLRFSLIICLYGLLAYHYGRQASAQSTLPSAQERAFAEVPEYVSWDHYRQVRQFITGLNVPRSADELTELPGLPTTARNHDVWGGLSMLHERRTPATAGPDSSSPQPFGRSDAMKPSSLGQAIADSLPEFDRENIAINTGTSSQNSSQGRVVQPQRPTVARLPQSSAGLKAVEQDFDLQWPVQELPPLWSGATLPSAVVSTAPLIQVSELKPVPDSQVQVAPQSPSILEPSLAPRQSTPTFDAAPPRSLINVPCELPPIEPMFEQIIAPDASDAAHARLIAPATHRHRNCLPAGVGREWVMHAPFEVDTTQPLNHYRLGLNLAYNHMFPDRSEYLWAAPPRIARPEQSVDYQDVRFMFEVGGPKMSVATELPIRVSNPVLNRNHAGLADMNIATKIVLMTGSRLQVTQILKTFINTGSTTMGLGNGHASMEPGILGRYKLNEANYLHGQLKYWFPLGGNPIHGGEVLSHGYAWSHIAYDSDDLALLYSLEAVHWAALDGRRSVPGVGLVDVDGDNIVNLFFGSRIVADNGGDLGPVEYGINWGTAVTGNKWYSNLLRFEARISY